MDLSLSDIATIVSSVCGVIIMVGGIARMVLGYWFKQQKEMQKLRDANKALEIKRIEEILEGLRKQLKMFENKMDLIHGKIRDNTASAERVVQAQIAFVASVEKRLKIFEENFENGKYGTVKVK